VVINLISGGLSRDGLRFVYSAGLPDGDIVEFGTDRKLRGNLVATSRAEVANWSRGDQFVYITNVLGTAELWIRSSDRQLGDSQGFVNQRQRSHCRKNRTDDCRWSRDGRWIFYVAFDGVLRWLPFVFSWEGEKTTKIQKAAVKHISVL
jgi:dipeptidyl aminopeptidase/acylaminoacyl peptidase